MKKKYYTLGLALLVLGCLSGMIVDTLTFVLAILGAVLVLISNQKLWIKLFTILLVPPIVIYGFVLVLFLLS